MDGGSNLVQSGSAVVQMCVVGGCMRSVVVQIGIRGVVSVMAKSCVVSDYVVQFEIQIRVQIVVVQVYMVQLGFRVGVTSMWFRCMCPCCVTVYMWLSLW